MPDTSKPFDVRVVNSLERPTINDFNLAQAASRTSVQALAQSALDLAGYASSGPGGFIGAGFQVRDLTPTAMAVQINPGIGFLSALAIPVALNVGGVTGVDVFNSVPTVPVVLTQPRTIVINNAPPSGYARRDIIAIKFSTEGELVDPLVTDTFNPLTQVFTPVSKNKTFTWALDDAEIETLPIGGAGTASKKIVYIPGTDQPYTAPDDLLTYTLPTVPTGYIVLAIVNVIETTIVIPQDNICDHRPIVFPTRSIAIPISFDGGSALGVPGAYLANFNNPRLPQNAARAIITKSGNATSNRYVVTVPGIANAQSITGTFVAGGPVLDGNPVNHSFANLVTTTAQTAATEGYGYRLTHADVLALADPTLSNPAIQYAVGQPYSRVELALGVVDISLPGMNYAATAFDTAGTPTRTITGTVTLAY